MMKKNMDLFEKSIRILSDSEGTLEFNQTFGAF